MLWLLRIPDSEAHHDKKYAAAPCATEALQLDTCYSSTVVRHSGLDPIDDVTVNVRRRELYKEIKEVMGINKF